jgi:hypothetical protein
MASRPAAGGGRFVDVAPERLERWLAGFAERHGDVTVKAGSDRVTVTAADGGVAECHVPFAPLASSDSDGGPDPDSSCAGLIAHAQRQRRVGVLLVRLGGYAVGVFDGQTLVTSKVGSRQVHGRNSNGGWSQQRYARRRGNQVRDALDETADVAARVLAGHRLDGFVTGGDRAALATVLADPRLRHLSGITEPRVLDVPDPKLAVLTATPPLYRAVRVRIIDPDPSA